MVHKTEPGPGQIAFESMPLPSQEPLDLSARCAFGRILTPHFFNLAPETVPAVVSPEAYERVSPDTLGKAIFAGGKQSVSGVLWNSEEYSAMARNVEALGQASMAKTLQARQLDPDADRRQEAAERSAVRTLFGDGIHRQYYEKMQGMLATYEQERHWLVRLLNESYTPGWAHMNAGDMLVLATSVWRISFEGHLLRAVSEHSGWGREQNAEAQGAMRYSLFYDRQKTKLSYWQGLMGVAMNHNRVKSVLLKTRLKQIERQL